MRNHVSLVWLALLLAVVPFSLSCAGGDPDSGGVPTCGGSIVFCSNGDDCCPIGCASSNDDDCQSTCGNSIVEPGETCDGNCPRSCDDGNSCTVDVLTGSEVTCNAECESTDITTCENGDGCCAEDCTSVTDNDCSASCGNDTI